ncbi:unnamed protein product [Periconia digitata]|uniref:Aminotransferase n=1 Tax=Periconia digitata TaxID=1303443 RepID=A0A9W4XQW4_9PLEO|nr:unnamed protein product [Periconia digitata]
MPSESEFHLFTSLRYDPILLTSEENSQPWLNYVSPSPFYMLAYHRDRMLEAAQHFDFHTVAEKLQSGESLHEELSKEVKEYIEKGGQDEAMKLRILFDKDGNMTVEFMPLPPVPLTTLYPPSLSPPNPASQRHPANTSTNAQPDSTVSLSSNDSSSLSKPDPPEWVFRLDTAATPSTPFTLLKTTYRDFYDQSRNRALPNNPQGQAYTEVLLYNEVSELTEGTMTSLYLFRGGRWVTPPVGVPVGEFNSSTLKTSGDGNKDADEGELRKPFAGRWGHSVRSAKVGAGGQRGTSRRWALKKGFCMEEPVSVDTVTVGEGVWVSNGVRGFGFGRVVE